MSEEVRGVREEYLREVKETLSSGNVMRQIQRSCDAHVDDFLFELGHYINILRPENCERHILANIGCGNGIHNLVLYPFYHQIINVDPIESMMEQCRYICRNLTNMKYICDYGENISQHVERDIIDHVLISGVAYTLKDINILRNILFNVSKIIRRPGKLLLGLIPDQKKKDPYLRSLPGILHSKGFSEEDINAIVERNRHVLWYSLDDIDKYMREAGAIKVTRYDTNIQHIGRECQSDVLFEF